ncbi:related to thymidylate kinase [Ustilago trichophora]|uniref:Thymidylate kinase n=1 Tax=Ustilago trichophora TaxID=86804 RepID=A0A5C3E820_9BASI|nr:related to thymidylate kinase [Ustilago trichophora]
MSSSRKPSGHAPIDADSDRSPRRKLSTDLIRIKNFPSTLSLRKQDPDTPPRSDAIPSSGTFSRFKAFAQSSRQSRTSTGGDQADASTDSKPSKRTSRLLDAFKPSKKPPPSFEVVRKPPNRSTTSFHSTTHQPSPQLDVHRSVSRLSVHNASEVPEPAPRISLSAPQPEPTTQPAPLNTPNAPSIQTQETITTRSQYPPSTTKTRRYSSNLSGATARRTSDPYLNLGSVSNSNSRAHSPSASPNLDAANLNTSFSLRSFRNVRSTSDVSTTADEPGAHTHSRVQSIISVDEYVTPGEELPEPRFIDDNGHIASTAAVSERPTFPDMGPAQSTSPAPNAKPASISAAKFRQASRQRSESGTIPTIDAVQAGSGFARPPRSRTPSQDLAAMEAVLAQTHPRAYRASDADRRKSADPVSLPAAASALNLNDDTQRKKRGFFIVVEGLDRAGKSTQVERLAEHLQAKAIKFPERTTAIGQMINSYLAQTSDLDDQAIHLLFSANRWECVASIKKTLEAGESIVCDRYAFSGIAYSVAKGLSYDWCRNPDVGLPLPDLTMFLDLDAQTAAARGGYGEERYEKLDFQAKVRDAFSRVSQDVKAHGGRWVTIDASKTLDQVTDDIQKAVQRVTSSIDRVGAKLGKLFVSEPRPANQRAGSSNELYPPIVLPNVKRSSVSSEDSGRRGKSLDQPRIQINTATTNGSFPASRPSGSPLTYTEQLAAVRAAAAGTLSGLFGGSNATLDQQNPAANSEKPLPEVDGPSPVNANRGQGFDSARVLAKYPEGSGRRRTLIDVIGEIENQPQQAQQAAWNEHRRSLSAAAESTSPTLQSPADGFPSTFAQAGRVRRSTDHGRVSQLPTIASSHSPPGGVAPRSASLTVQPGGTSVSSPSTPAVGEKPLPSPSSMRASSFSSAVGAGSADPSLSVRSSTLSPAARTASPAITTSSRSSLASPPPQLQPATSSPPIPRPASTTPAAAADYPPFTNNTDLSSHHLSMLNVAQGQAEMQEQYMRNYMAMMTNPMLAQQAHYQMMLQRHQQQYYGRAASAFGGAAGSNLGAGANGNGVIPNSGGPPLAAFMQPQPSAAVQQGGEAVKSRGERQRSSHKRTQSSGSLLESSPTGGGGGQGAATAAGNQPMLSMMMAPPPPVTPTTASSGTGAGGQTSSSFGAQYYPYPQHQMYSLQQQQQQQQQQTMFYPNGAAFPQMMGGTAWAAAQQQQQQQQMMGAYAARAAGFAPTTTRSEIAVPSHSQGLRSQRSTEKGLRAQQQQ